MLLNISQHSDQTLQEQITGQIRNRILRGELKPPARLDHGVRNGGCVGVPHRRALNSRQL
jgi:hypothetical protein